MVVVLVAVAVAVVMVFIVVANKTLCSYHAVIPSG